MEKSSNGGCVAFARGWIECCKHTWRPISLTLSLLASDFIRRTVAN